MADETKLLDPERLVGRRQLSLTVSERWMAALSGTDEEAAE